MIMNQLPDFSRAGYQVKRQLGENQAGDSQRDSFASRSSYLAIHTPTQHPVVIKQYKFAKFGSDWSGFSAYQNEIQVLKELSHPGIPRYLSAFEIANGFCTVREGKNAQSLSHPRTLDPDSIKKIAISLLDILVYLQNKIPPVIHGNIKPENILVDDELKVYLVDFGFPYIGSGGERQTSVAGTVGFMPLEQLQNKNLAATSDIFSIGATFISLLTQTPSHKIESLSNSEGRINFAAIIPKEISRDFMKWLKKITEPAPNKRYQNAAAALKALKLIDLRRSPEVKLRPKTLDFIATQYGETLTQIVTIVNSTPEITLKGFWKVATHPKESQLSPHPWISFNPAQVEGNKITCEITVDTHKLMADKIYKREILLEINASQAHHSLHIQVKTAPIGHKLPQRSLSVLFLLALAGGAFGGLLVSATGVVTSIYLIQLIIGMAIGSAGGVGAAFNYIPLFGGTGTLIAVLAQVPFAGLGMIGGYFIGLVIGTVTGYVVKYHFDKELKSGLSDLIAAVFSFSGGISFLIAAFGLSLGIQLTAGFHLLIIVAWAAAGIRLGRVLYGLHIERSQLMEQYRKFESRLIKP